MILLTGAPPSSTLKWGEECLSAPLLAAFGNTHSEQSDGDILIPTLSTLPAWRRLPLVTKHLPSGLSQQSVYLNQNLVKSTHADDQTSFFTTSDYSLLPDDTIVEGSQTSLRSESGSDNALSQFYEHSFNIHDEVPASNVTALLSFDDQTLEMPPDSAQDDREPPQSNLTRPKPRSTRLTTLKEIPNAAYLCSLEPQTMTVDLVVGILHISQLRSIKSRRYNRRVELVELTVADDTKSGFGVSIWLPQDQSTNLRKTEEQDLRSRVSSIRPRDIVLVKNLALTSFQKKVHGQSLRKANTTLDLLYRSVMDSHDEPGAYSLGELGCNDTNDVQLCRVKQVKEWVMSFVGSGPDLPFQSEISSKDPRVRTRLQQQLPSDTP